MQERKILFSRFSHGTQLPKHLTLTFCAFDITSESNKGYHQSVTRDYTDRLRAIARINQF